MRANDLRLGNLIQKNGKVHYTNIFTIRNIKNLSIDDTDVFEPIPITEDWLLKFGFERVFTNDYWYQIRIGDKRLLVSILGNVEIEKWDRAMIAFHDICKYVHQLQNLYFALCGEELVFSSTEP